MRIGRIFNAMGSLAGASLSLARAAGGRAGLGWRRLRPAQQLIAGFLGYWLIGLGLLSLPISREQPCATIDDAFTVASAISTTGLSTVSVRDTYSFFGEFIVVFLFQLGGLGFMTASSLFVLARGGSLSPGRVGVLRAGFSLPRNFVVGRFLVHTACFTAACETIGALVLWWRFSALGVEAPLWHAVFHSISAFATAGFSLNNSSLEAFAGDGVVCATIGLLSYAGAIGFIVAQDVWYSIRFRERMLTLTSKVILTLTAGIFAGGTVLLYLLEPSLRGMAPPERLLAAAFQTMTASTTAGFNTVPIGGMSSAGLIVLMIAMLVGASPAGTGGGIKTTGVSALLATLVSIARGRDLVAWLGHEIPVLRVLWAVAAATLYLIGLVAGLLALSITEDHAFLPLVFEAASAIGTVGLSMGITGSLSAEGKVVVILLMLVGRVGPLTIGAALMRPAGKPDGLRRDDLAV